MEDARLVDGGCARIGTELNEPHQLRVEQLDDARGTNRLLVRTADADITERRPLQLELVGADAATVGVVRMAEPGIEHQFPGKGLVLDQRHPQPILHSRRQWHRSAPQRCRSPRAVR